MKCPICGEPTKWQENPDRPFCSERCRIIDLGNWSSEDYKVSVPLPDVADSPEQKQE
ncbi:MAG TPA: DNA gyrase inhibitor YacG [Blastocatellia bacterium]|jgi:endogenous inhibitor of DNA gyrase (YacG/DUF329 family)